MRFLYIYLILTTLGLFIIIGFTAAIAFGANSKANELSNSKADQLQINTQVIRLQQNISSLKGNHRSLKLNFEALDHLSGVTFKKLSKDIENVKEATDSKQLDARLNSLNADLNSLENLHYNDKVQLVYDHDNEMKKLKGDHDKDIIKLINYHDTDMDQVGHDISSKINAAKGTLRREMGELKREIQGNA